MTIERIQIESFSSMIRNKRKLVIFVIYVACHNDVLCLKLYDFQFGAFILFFFHFEHLR